MNLYVIENLEYRVIVKAKSKKKAVKYVCDYMKWESGVISKSHCREFTGKGILVKGLGLVQVYPTVESVAGTKIFVVNFTMGYSNSAEVHWVVVAESAKEASYYTRKSIVGPEDCTEIYSDKGVLFVENLVPKICDPPVIINMDTGDGSGGCVGATNWL